MQIWYKHNLCCAHEVTRRANQLSVDASCQYFLLTQTSVYLLQFLFPFYITFTIVVHITDVHFIKALLPCNFIENTSYRNSNSLSSPHCEKHSSLNSSQLSSIILITSATLVFTSASVNVNILSPSILFHDLSWSLSILWQRSCSRS